MSIGSMGLISAGAASACGFARVLEVSAALFALCAVCAAVLTINPPSRVRFVPCDVAASCGDRPGVQPALAGGASAATEAPPPQ